MKTRERWSVRCTVLVVTVLAGSVSAGLIDNNPEANKRASGPNGWSQLNPWRATFMPAGSCAWLTTGLDAQGYREIRPGIDNPATIGDGRWTINRRTLTGNLSLDMYKAWVEVNPALNIAGTQVYNNDPAPGYGGALMGLRYVPGAGDPTTGINWLQVIRTNVPLNAGDNPGAYEIYLDNARNRGTSPFYNFAAAGSPNGVRTNADGTFRDAWVADGPARRIKNGVDWQAQMFVSTWDSAREVINIYDGVWWGFNLGVPTPGTLTLAGLGGVFAFRRRRNA
ncbi:MAG: PEP-CTERM sorting domain-containing protein [Planctomycetota bacterium]